MIRFVHLRLESAEPLSPDIVALTLVPLRAGMVLPPFEPGAHIELHLPTPGVPTVRCYALVNPPAERHHYRVWVRRSRRAAAGAGWGVDDAAVSAATWLLDEARPGQTLRVSAPRRHWALVDSEAPALFITHGIGLAAVWGMLECRQARGLPWELHHAADDAAQAAFWPRLRALAAGGTASASSDSAGLQRLHPQLHLHPSPQPGWPDALTAPLQDALRAAPADAQAYACGPRNWLDAVSRAWQPHPTDQLHTESFDAAEAQRRGGFVVKLQRSGRELVVKPGETVLEAVLAAGVEAAYSCRAGHCGACEVTVLAGEPEHRDLVLSPQAHQEGRMMICCSGSRTPELVLDL